MISFRFNPCKASDQLARRRTGLYRTAPVATALFAFVATTALMFGGVSQAVAAGPQLEDVLEAQAAVDAAAAQSQQKINTMTSRTRQAAAKYAQVLAQAKSYERYNKRLSDQIQSQQVEIASIKRQLDEIKDTAREIQPLMENMVQSLARFVSLDLPFLPKERTQRIQKLKHLMTRVDVTIAEKYRQILHAYMIELNYGHTLGAYKGTLGHGKNARTVQFVRVGRVTLMYQTLDGSETGYWDAKKHKWVVDNSYAEAFQVALDMAKKRGTPQLLTVPVPVPQEVQE